MPAEMSACSGEPRGGARIEETERVLGELNARYGGRMRGVRSDELPTAPAQRSDIPMDEKGEPIWSEIEPERGYAFIVDSMRDTTIDGFIEGNTKCATKELAKHR